MCNIELMAAARNMIDALESGRYGRGQRVDFATNWLDNACTEAERAAEAPANTPRRAGRRWTSTDELFLYDAWGDTLRGLDGDPERAVEALARALERTPVAVAARLVQLGIWN